MISIVSFLLLAWPALALKLQDERQSPKRLYYVRSPAGLSNVRMQFEAMVATAAAYDRILVIPPRTEINHVPEPFLETDIWSEKDLAKAIRFEYVDAGRAWCPPGSFQLVGKGLETLQPHDLPADKDWCFGAQETVVRNFECQHIFSPDQQKVATKAVFNGLQIKQHFIQKAREALGSLGLKPGHFVAAHLRHGDFNLTWLQLTMEKTASTLNLYGKGQDVLILTDDTDPTYVSQLKGNVTAATSLQFSSSVIGQAQLKLEGAVVDMLLGAMAGTFIGTPSSTFSNSIYQIRTKMEMCKKAPRSRHAEALMSEDARVRVTRWFDSSPNLIVPHHWFAFGTKCQHNNDDWKKITDYKDFDYYGDQAVCELEDVQ